MKTISAVVAGTGFEGREGTIRAFCREGAPVELRREPNNPHDPEAIAVWMECRALFGLVRRLRQIGYIKAKRADTLAKRMDSGALVIQRAYVRSYYAPRGREHPRVSLTIEAEEAG